MEKLLLPEQIILLALDDDSGSFIADSDALSFALAASVILELSLQGAIEISSNKLRSKQTVQTTNTSLKEIQARIANQKKEKELQTWIEELSFNYADIKKHTIQQLLDKGILQKKENKFLWIFTITKYPAQNPIPENRLRRRIKDIMELGKKATTSELMLLSLIDASNLIDEFFGKETEQAYSKKIQQLMKEDDTALHIHESVKQVHESILTLSTVLMLTTTTAVIHTS